MSTTREGLSTVLTVAFPPYEGWDWHNIAKVGWGITDLFLWSLGEYEERYYYIPCTPDNLESHPLKDYFMLDVANYLARFYYCIPSQPPIKVSDEITIGDFAIETKDAEEEIGEGRETDWLTGVEMPVSSPFLYETWVSVSAISPTIQDGTRYCFVEDTFLDKRVVLCSLSNWVAWGIEVDVSARSIDTIVGKIHRVLGISLPMIVVGKTRIHKRKINGREVLVAIKTGEEHDDGVCEVLRQIVGLDQLGVYNDMRGMLYIESVPEEAK